ncbi:DUF3107 domain-containing protein [Actinotalea sp. BY-33]|uniref:DUF3107 domain-containing protein n=1 Tax=Actinotalea soli TaxID=2819234 RepID=A0A939RSW6_9CELL|nr:DUF3107 domain-containing protein [Actinotalea soli]MBO1752737.1 DUF3107 domain-containing protein [Actinotalea soli]
MEITIGVQNVARELVVETDQPSEKVAKDVLKALEVGAPVDITDAKGRRVIVPASTVAYVELGGEEARKVGFHNI